MAPNEQANIYKKYMKKYIYYINKLYIDIFPFVGTLLIVAALLKLTTPRPLISE